MPLDGKLPRAVFHVRHALRRKRVGREVGGSRRAVEAVARLEAREEVLHPVRVEAGCVERGDPHAVCLALGVL